MSKFEDFLMEKHAEGYIGTKDCMIDDFNKWVQELGCDDFITYADEFAKEQSKELLEALRKSDSIAEELVNLGDMTSEGRAAMRIADKLHKIIAQAIAKAETTNV